MNRTSLIGQLKRRSVKSVKTCKEELLPDNDTGDVPNDTPDIPGMQSVFILIWPSPASILPHGIICSSNDIISVGGKIMKNLSLKNTDMKISAVGIGCMRLVGLPDEKALLELVDTALENGINFFDHADIYGGGRWVGYSCGLFSCCCVSYNI